MKEAIWLLATFALTAWAIHQVYEHGRPHPDEFDDIAAMAAQQEARAAIERATTRNAR